MEIEGLRAALFEPFSFPGSRQTVTMELKKKGVTWGEAQHVAKGSAMDGPRWRQIVNVLCPTRDSEDQAKPGA